MHDILCVLSVRLLWSGESYLFPFLFVDVLKFTPHKLQFFFFKKQFCKITNVMNFMEMWCNLHNCISMHDILCVHYLWIDLFSRTCMCITSTKLPISFPKKKNCVSVNAIEFLHRWCYGFSNEILTRVRHGNECLICYAAWAESGNMYM